MSVQVISLAAQQVWNTTGCWLVPLPVSTHLSKSSFRSNSVDLTDVKNGVHTFGVVEFGYQNG